MRCGVCDMTMNDPSADALAGDDGFADVHWRRPRRETSAQGAPLIMTEAVSAALRGRRLPCARLLQ